MVDIQQVAVIDIGKTNAKLVLVERKTGKQIAAFGRSNSVINTGPYPHYDIDGLWDFILDALKQLQAAHRVDGISITTHGASAALVNADGLVLPVLDYEHGGMQTDGYLRPDFVETLSPALPDGLNLGAQIYWQSKTFPENFTRATAILMYPQYWAWRLTGVLASEVTSLGVHTDLWNPSQAGFSSLVDREGWRDLFPPMKPAISILGGISSAVSDLTNLPEGTPVACGIHDSNASLLPYLRKGPISIISSGTWTITMTIGGTISELDPTRDCLANVDAFGRPVPTARFMGGREYSELMDGNDATPTISDIEKTISSGAMILPSFAPGVGPFPNGEGRWVGDFLGDMDRAAAVVLYMALMTKTCLSLAGIGDAIVVEGPLASNKIYCLLLAELTGVSTYRSGDATGTSTGAAMLFGVETRENMGWPVAPTHISGLNEYANAWLKAAEA